MTFNIPDTDEGLAPPLQPQAPPEERGGGYTQVQTLQVTVREEIASLPPARSGDPDAFMAAAVDYLKERARRAAEADEVLLGIVVLIHVEYPRIEGESRGMERVHGFKFSRTVTLTGHVFVTSGSLSDAYAAGAECADLGAAFPVIHQLGLGERPAVIADLSSGEVVWCPRGAEDENAATPMSLYDTSPAAEDPLSAAIAELIERFHLAWTRAPGAHRGMWVDELSFVPAPDVEWRIQGMLFPVLWHRLRDTHIVRREDSVIYGRYDLSISGRPDRGGDRVSVVEITVLRTMRSAAQVGEPPALVGRADNERAIKDGLASAVYYREAVVGCSRVILCLFDMQRTDDGGALVRTYEVASQAHQVELQRYLVPNRARDGGPNRLRGRQN